MYFETNQPKFEWKPESAEIRMGTCDRELPARGFLTDSCRYYFSIPGSCPGRTWAAELLRLHSPSALPYCAAGMDPRVGSGPTDLEELVRGLKL